MAWAPWLQQILIILESSKDGHSPLWFLSTNGIIEEQFHKRHCNSMRNIFPQHGIQGHLDLLQFNLISFSILTASWPLSRSEHYNIACLSLRLSVENKNNFFNLCHNFWIVKDKSLHICQTYSANESLSNDTKVNDLVTLYLYLIH